MTFCEQWGKLFSSLLGVAFDNLEEEKKTDIKPVSGTSGKRKIFKRVLITLLLLPFVLVLTAAVLLYVPAVQQWAVGLVTQQLHKTTGMDITVGEVHLAFPLDLSVKSVEAYSAEGDTIALLGELRTRIPITPLTRSRIETSNLTIRDVYFDYFLDSLKESRITAKAQEIEVANLLVDLKKEKVAVGAVGLNSGLFRYWSVDTVPNPDPQPVRWQIEIKQASVQNFDTRIELPLHKVYTGGHIRRGSVHGIDIALDDFELKMDHSDLDLYSGGFATKAEPTAAPFVDYTNMSLYDVHANFDDFYFKGLHLAMGINDVRLRERCGAVVERFRGEFEMKNEVITVSDFSVRTDKSDIEGDIVLPLTLFTAQNDTAFFKAIAQGYLHPQDLTYFTTIDINSLGGKSSATPLISDEAVELEVDFDGTLRFVSLNRIEVAVPRAFDLFLSGEVHDVLLPKARKGKAEIRLSTYSGLERWLMLGGDDLAYRVSVPSQSSLNADVSLNGNNVGCRLRLRSGEGGGLSAAASYNLSSKGYKLDLEARDLDVEGFLPQDSIGVANISLQAYGLGTDFLSPKTSAGVHLNVQSLQYKQAVIEEITADGRLHDGEMFASLNSMSPGANFYTQIDALIKERTVSGSIRVQVDTLDAQMLGFSEKPLNGRMTLEGDLFTDFKQQHRLQGEVSDLRLILDQDSLSFESFMVSGATSESDVRADISSGDLRLRLNAATGLNDLIARSSELARVATSYAQDSIGEISLEVPLQLLPHFSLEAVMGLHNPAQYLLQKNALFVNGVDISVQADSVNGITGDFLVRGFRKDAYRVDQAHLSLSTEFSSAGSVRQSIERLTERLTQSDMRPVLERKIDEVYGTESKKRKPVLRADLSVHKERYLNQAPFDLNLTTETDLRSADLYASYANAQGVQYAAGLLGYYNAKGFGLTIKDSQPLVVAGEKVSVNADNSLFYFKENKKIFANLLLSGFDGAEVQLLSDKETQQTEQLSLIIRRLQLERIAPLTGLTAPISGMTFADIRLEREEERIRATGDVSINELRYNNERIGNIGMALFYEPRDNSSHYVTAQINHDGELALSADGRYNAHDKESPIAMNAVFEDFPLALVNPILGAELATIDGVVQGQVKVSGTPQDIHLNGAPLLKEAKIYLPQLGNTFVLDSKPLVLQDSKLSFEDYALRVEGKKEPLRINGHLYVLGKNALQTNLSLKANEVQLLDSSYKPGQLLYGKIFASADLTMRGKLTAPVVRGRVGILGGTNVTYVYSQSAVKAGDKLSGFVEFVDFSDTLFVPPIRANKSPQSSMDIALTALIDPAVIAGVDLSPGHQDYVQIVGGGSLSFALPPFGEMSLIGTYEAEGGEVRYNFPVVGRKSFVIDPSSTISWSGRPENPYIRFQARQAVRANVVEGEATRKVDFEVSIAASETLEKLDLQFDLDAPQDISIQSEIASMTPEERAKQAVALMVSGSFLAGSDPSQMKMETILSGLAVNELNNLLGKSLEGTDLNVGMELHDPSGSGTAYTNYTYSFSRRFYNNRIRFVIGGKVAAGNVPTNYEQTFIDNVTLEYRLDKAGRQYLSLFHKRNSDNILEGLINETGIGYIIKGKLDRLSDLFNFLRPKNKKKTPPNPSQKSSLPLSAIPEEEESNPSTER